MQVISIKVNDSSKEVLNAKAGVGDGAPTVIKANKGLNFQLIDEATSKSPSHVVAKRSGNDLFISIEEGADIADIVIEGFYTSDSMLIGVDEKGQNFYYISDSGEFADLVTELSSGDVKMQVLGGEAQPTPYWVGAANQPAESVDGAGGILPWLAGITLVGGGIAIASSDSDDDSDSHESSDNESAKGEVNADDITGSDDSTVVPEETANEANPTDNPDELSSQPEQSVPSSSEEDEVTEPTNQKDTDKGSDNEDLSVSQDSDASVDDSPSNTQEDASDLKAPLEEDELKTTEDKAVDANSDSISIGDVLTDYKPKNGYSLTSNDESVEIDLVDTNTESNSVYESNTNNSSSDAHVYADSNLANTANTPVIEESVVI